MKDNFDREINYMRISITDRCNLRCKYCMPEGIDLVPMENLLTFEEIVRVCEQAAKIGIRHIKITGGEPLVRRGAASLIGMIRNIPGIDTVSLTTNGILLGSFLSELKKNGLTRINISLDTMDPVLYHQITGKDAFHQVMDNFSMALDLGFKIKINSVLMKGINEPEWEPLADFAKTTPVDIRFIEIMPIGIGKNYECVSNQELMEKLHQKYPAIKKNNSFHGNGPAVYYSIPEFQGDIGFISAIHGKFCDRCNRIRMNAQGQLKPCLCYGRSIDLRKILRQNDNHSLKMALERGILEKPQAHCFDNPDKITEENKMISIGG